MWHCLDVKNMRKRLTFRAYACLAIYTLVIAWINLCYVASYDTTATRSATGRLHAFWFDSAGIVQVHLLVVGYEYRGSVHTRPMVCLVSCCCSHSDCLSVCLPPCRLSVCTSLFACLSPEHV